MKRLLCLMALLMACVYALPLVTVGLGGGQDPEADPQDGAGEARPSYDADTVITL